MPTDATIQDRQQEIVDEFALFDDWMGRYEHLIDMGRRLPPLDDAFKTDAHKIRGCQSQVWVHAEEEDGAVRYAGDSDAAITKGLVALLIRVLDDQPPEAIVQADLGFLDAVGMKEHLSPTRKNGLAAMVDQMRARAQAYRATA